MRRAAIASVVLAALVVSACGGGGDEKPKDNGSTAARSNKPVSITFWVGFEQRELGVVKQAVDQFHRTHPWITVKTVGAVSDDKIIAAIRSGNAPDAVQSFTADNTGAFCSSGGWIDLKDYIDRDKVDINVIPKAVQGYTEFDGKRCSMPMLADTYGFYWNKKLFAKA